MRLFVDENLSPRLVSIDLLGVSDPKILDFCVGEDRVCVTNNAGDFRELLGSVELHPGLIVLPNVARESQLQLLGLALEVIEQRAEEAEQFTRDLMVNHVLEVDVTGACELHELPAGR